MGPLSKIHNPDFSAKERPISKIPYLWLFLNLKFSLILGPCNFTLIPSGHGLNPVSSGGERRAKAKQGAVPESFDMKQMKKK